MKISILFGCCLLLFSAAVGAQPARPAPTLTTDDVVSSRPAAPVAPVAGKPADKEEKPVTLPATKAPPASADPRQAAEKEWNERLRQAQEKTRALELQADQAELAITQLRNQLFSATAQAPEARGQITARLNELTGQVNRVRAEAKVAQQEVEALQAEGRSKEFKVQGATLTDENGTPNKDAYQSEYDRLSSELQAAQARLGVLQMRLNANQSETLKKANGDNFTLNRLRAEKEQAAAELEDTRSKIEALTQQLQTHRQKAAAVGVPLR